MPGCACPQDLYAWLRNERSLFNSKTPFTNGSITNRQAAQVRGAAHSANGSPEDILHNLGQHLGQVLLGQADSETLFNDHDLDTLYFEAVKSVGIFQQLNEVCARHPEINVNSDDLSSLLSCAIQTQVYPF